jgi:tRNA-splicing endonuclease subunit Sen2
LPELTSEEITAKRRADRKQFKLDRAKAIAEATAEAEAAFAEGRVIAPALSGPTIPSASTWRPPPSQPEPLERLDDNSAENEDLPQDVEHLQLTLSEAFFLSWNLDCLTILDPQSVSVYFLQS